ncbi:hypothetical protein QFZ77_006779 [Paenibacillus sp. V4I3]|uniref:sulfotransferase family 2 domain-containing protein n=1 Tax=unclassified Paenibacillus TaxID=185978 RepID=UPI00277F9416|nr:MULTISPECIES: sulfotransferase family 2 domain-containing protein [unclassified Paenibacillus]MDQ0878120.1 hypothetical protein [Paenibacillus sp. V4I3]MDQ0886058.1 hypothetical protein [Paenibacillus sp. V4I9]
MSGDSTQTKKLLIFMHIPKTAGSTLGELINQQYTKNISCYRGDESENEKDVIRLKDEIEKSDSLKGHFYFGVHHYLSKPSIYITMFRNPIERIISLYYYILREKNNRLYEKVKNMSLDEFVKSEELAIENVNQQTRYLCGGRTPDLETAKKNLSAHFSFGIMELFDDSIRLMSKELGWKNIHYIKRNVNGNSPPITSIAEKTIHKIIENNTLDIELYHYARQLLINKKKTK